MSTARSIGGESGPRARPMQPERARDLLARCCASEVSTVAFVKQSITSPKRTGFTTEFVQESSDGSLAAWMDGDF